MRAVMDQDLEELVARASDPRWIPAIYNYCDRRCARCRFSERCFAFDEEVRQGAPAQDVMEVASRSLGRSLRLLHAYAESEGLDLGEGDPEEAPARGAAEGDPLVVAAHHYAAECGTLLNALESQLGADAALDVRDAIDSLQWLSTMIGPKIYRALAGLADLIPPSGHPVQNDAHGSAKTARLMIADSLAAWRVVNAFGRAAPESPTRSLAARLERIDADLAAHIPRAMEFVRPGFDEPLPGAVRPWSLTADEERRDRRLLAASGILTKLKDFGRGLLARFKRSSEP
jgi:hypothetical protein